MSLEKKSDDITKYNERHLDPMISREYKKRYGIKKRKIIDTSKLEVKLNIKDEIERNESKKEKRENNEEEKKINDNEGIKSTNRPKTKLPETKTRETTPCSISIKINPTIDLPLTNSHPSIHTIIIPTSSQESPSIKGNGKASSSTNFPSTPTLIPSNDGKEKIPTPSENNPNPLKENNPTPSNTSNTTPPPIPPNDPSSRPKNDNKNDDKNDNKDDNKDDNNSPKGIKTNSNNNDNNNGNSNNNNKNNKNNDNNDNNDNNNNSNNNNNNNNDYDNNNPQHYSDRNSPTAIMNPSPTISPSTYTGVSPTRTSSPRDKIFNPSSGPAITGVIFAIVLALVAIAFIIRKTVYNKNYFTRQNRHQQLLDNEGWPNYNTYDVNNIEVMDSNNNINNASTNVITLLNRPQRTMSRRFSNFDDITRINSGSNTGSLIDDEMSRNDDDFSYSSGIRQQQEYEGHVSDDDDYSSSNMSIDITLPPKIVNWEECMR